MRQGQSPAVLLACMGEGAGIVAVGTAFQPVKKHQERAIRRAIKKIDIDEIAIWCIPALAAQGEAAGLDQQRPDRLRVPPREPAWRVISRGLCWHGFSEWYGAWHQ